jgi:hypothetical protein
MVEESPGVERGETFLLAGDIEPASGMVMTCLLLEFALRGDFAFAIASITPWIRKAPVNQVRKGSD